jgi:hypothetical protein
MERGWSQGEGAESRPGSITVFVFVLSLLLSFQGDVWVVGGEASSAGQGQEAGKLGRVYMPWPQSGRTQYEETNKQTDISKSKLVEHSTTVAQDNIKLRKRMLSTKESAFIQQ